MESDNLFKTNADNFHSENAAAIFNQRLQYQEIMLEQAHYLYSPDYPLLSPLTIEGLAKSDLIVNVPCGVMMTPNGRLIPAAPTTMDMNYLTRYLAIGNGPGEQLTGMERILMAEWLKNHNRIPFDKKIIILSGVDIIKEQKIHWADSMEKALKELGFTNLNSGGILAASRNSFEEGEVLRKYMLINELTNATVMSDGLSWGRWAFTTGLREFELPTVSDSAIRFLKNGISILADNPAWKLFSEAYIVAYIHQYIDSLPYLDDLGRKEQHDLFKLVRMISIIGPKNFFKASITEFQLMAKILKKNTRSMWRREIISDNELVQLGKIETTISPLLVDQVAFLDYKLFEDYILLPFRKSGIRTFMMALGGPALIRIGGYYARPDIKSNLIDIVIKTGKPPDLRNI